MQYLLMKSFLSVYFLATVDMQETKAMISQAFWALRNEKLPSVCFSSQKKEFLPAVWWPVSQTWEVIRLRATSFLGGIGQMDDTSLGPGHCGTSRVPGKGLNCVARCRAGRRCPKVRLIEASGEQQPYVGGFWWGICIALLQEGLLGPALSLFFHAKPLRQEGALELWYLELSWQ